MRHVFTIFFLVFIFSCSKQRAALYHFNQVNDLVKKTENFLNTYLQKIDETMINDRASNPFAEAELLRQKLTNKIGSYINKAKKTHSLKEDDSYHHAAIQYFEGLRSIVSNELKQIIDINKIIVTSGERSDSVSILSVAFQNKRNNYAGEFIKVRDAFAKKYEIILQTNEKADNEQ